MFNHLKMAFQSVNYHLTLWLKAKYEKINHIHSWITWYIRPGHGILCLGSQVLYKHFRGPCLFCLFRGGDQNSGKTFLYNTCTLPCWKTFSYETLLRMKLSVAQLSLWFIIYYWECQYCPSKSLLSPLLSIFCQLNAFLDQSNNWKFVFTTCFWTNTIFWLHENCFLF